MNDRVVTELGTKANPKRDRIAVDGKIVRSAEPHVYIVLNKPAGVITTLSDPQGRPAVGDLLAGIGPRVFPVGRLDFHSAGLLLLTNDGELALRLTHPRYGIRKTYRVKVKGRPDDCTLARLSDGVPLPDGKTAPAAVRVVEKAERKSWLEISIAEGKWRQVRRMCEAVGHPVEKLVRTRLGPLKLGGLKPGECRALTAIELAKLREAVAPGGPPKPRRGKTQRHSAPGSPR